MNKNFFEIEQNLKELKLDNYLSIIIIILSFANIIGDLIEQESIITNNQEKKVVAHNIYIYAIIGSTILYYIFFKRSAISLDKAKKKGDNIFPYFIRLIGSVFFIIGILCILFFNITERNNIDSPEI